MSSTSEQELERRIWLRVALIFLVAFPVTAAINAASLATDASRSGVDVRHTVLWVQEFTSVFVLLALVPAVALLERRHPVVPGRMLGSLAVLAAASPVFSGLHIAGMVALRKLLLPVITGEPYQFFGRQPLTDLLYEFRKDLFPYAIIIGLLTLSRMIEQSRQEAAAARQEARESGRLTLKSGGRTIHLNAHDLEWARANGNYVGIRAAGHTHLPRITLSALAEQLTSARVDVARVHRSHLVNRARVREVRPTSSGDVLITMADGTEVKGSRRYRDQIEA